jgi:hypothetical protein
LRPDGHRQAGEPEEKTEEDRSGNGTFHAEAAFEVGWLGLVEIQIYTK